MFEMANDYIRQRTPQFEVVGGYLSPVSDAYGKADLVSATHRVKMCNAAVQDESWIMVDPFEAEYFDDLGKPVYLPTAVVLRHFDHEINTVLGGIEAGPDGQRKKARIVLLIGTFPRLPMRTAALFPLLSLLLLAARMGPD
jgi:nicotinamide mononucleotide adenylyltransferase